MRSVNVFISIYFNNVCVFGPDMTQKYCYSIDDVRLCLVTDQSLYIIDVTQKYSNCINGFRLCLVTDQSLYINDMTQKYCIIGPQRLCLVTDQSLYVNCSCKCMQHTDYAFSLSTSCS